MSEMNRSDLVVPGGGVHHVGSWAYDFGTNAFSGPGRCFTMTLRPNLADRFQVVPAFWDSSDPEANWAKLSIAMSLIGQVG